jgi:hypothetical protein
MTSEQQEQIYGADAAIPSTFTRTVYKCTFNAFLRYIDMEHNPAALLAQDRRTIESQIIGYIRYLSEKKHYNRYSINPPLARKKGKNIKLVSTTTTTVLVVFLICRT